MDYMKDALQDPKHIVPSIIVGLLLSCGWEIVYNLDNDPYIRHSTGDFSTYSTWWDCLKAVIETASE